MDICSGSVLMEISGPAVVLQVLRMEGEVGGEEKPKE